MDQNVEEDGLYRDATGKTRARVKSVRNRISNSPWDRSKRGRQCHSTDWFGIGGMSCGLIAAGSWILMFRTADERGAYCFELISHRRVVGRSRNQ